MNCFSFSNTKAKFPVKLTEPLTSILYITADKVHMEEYKHAIHVREIAEGEFINEPCCEKTYIWGFAVQSQKKARGLKFWI